MFMKKLYLAYGSNLNLEQMLIRCGNAVPVGKTVLKHYRLVYKGSHDEYAYLTLEESEERNTPVGVFEITEQDEAVLDQYEGYPELYDKKIVEVTFHGKPVEALVYVMKPQFDYHLPSFQYVQNCMIGYEDFHFDKVFLEEALEYSRDRKEKVKKI